MRCSNYNRFIHPGYRLFSLVLRVLLILIPAGSCAQASYDLNDPRNPDCPCHKAQKLAEQEYAQLNAVPALPGMEQNADHPVAKAPVLPLNAPAAVHAGSTARSGKSRRRKKNRRITDLKFRCMRKQRGLRRLHADYAVCFHNW